MSNTQNDILASMLEQYKNNSQPKKKFESKTYDLKNYFNIHLPDGVDSGERTIRILPTEDGSTPLKEVQVHKKKVDGKWTTYFCRKHHGGEDCPFCEAREELLSTGKDTDKELAKQYAPKKMYVVKVIDRDKESEGVKFWRFNHAYDNKGVYDKIFGVLSAVKKDITHVETGRDLYILINRDQKGNPQVQSIQGLDPAPLSENKETAQAWLDDKRTFEDVYSFRSYEYLEIVVKGGVPVYDKESKAWVDKKALEAQKNETETLDSELSLGVQNVKNNITASTATPTMATSETDDAEGEDDLPF